MITIHSAKGTEQKVCYVANVSAGQYPHARAQGDFDEVEEERRVLYVAMTRAQNELILTKQNLSQWAFDQEDEQGRKVEAYFLSALQPQLCHIETHHQRQGFKSARSYQQDRIDFDFGIDLD